MRTPRLSAPFMLLMCLLCSPSTHAQTIRGVVVTGDGERIPQALVRLHASSEREPIEVLTDSAGRFGLQLRGPGTVLLSAEALGYAATKTDTLVVDRGEVVQVRLTLRVAPVEMSPLEVVARSRADFRLDPLRGFYERMDWGERIGAGHFITHEDGRLKGAARLSHVLGSAPGVRTYAHPAIPGALLVEVRTTATGACPVVIYLDGVEIRDAPIDDLVLPPDVHGIEIYRRPSELPAEFSGSNARCGVIAIWTRRSD